MIKVMKIYLLLIIVLYCISLEGQINPGARQISLSNSDVALSNDVFSIFNNPAGLGQMDWREIGIYYSPSPFGLKELANGFIAYNEPFPFGSVSFGGMSYGFDLYKETKIILGGSYNYLNRFFGGITFTFHHFSIKNYGTATAFYLSTGGLVYLTDRIRWGFSITNLNHASVANESDQIPMIFNSGFSYDVLNELSLNAAIEKDIRYKPSVMFGLDYDLIKYLSIRFGFANEPEKYSAGVGINYSYFSLDYAFFSHPELGLTHQAGLIIHFNENNTRSENIRKHLSL
jgi:hypothetical protein